jgi:hypothetical protein
MQATSFVSASTTESISLHGGLRKISKPRANLPGFCFEQYPRGPYRLDAAGAANLSATDPDLGRCEDFGIIAGNVALSEPN